MFENLTEINFPRLLIVRPERGWIFYIILLGLLPFLWYIASPLLTRTGPTNPYIMAYLPIVILTILIFLIWLCNQIIINRHVSLEKGPLFYPFIFLIISNILSLINANDVYSGIIIIFAWLYIFLAYLAIYNSMPALSYTERFGKYFIGMCIVSSIFGFFIWLSGLSAKGVNPFALSGLLESNHFAFILTEGLFLGMFFSMFSQQGLRSRLLYFLCFLLMLCALFFTFGRGAWLSCMIVFPWLIFLSLLRIRRITLRLAGYGIITLVLTIMVFSWSLTFQQRVLSILKGTEASMSRYEMDMAAWQAFLKTPVLGSGVNNFKVATRALGGRISYGTCNLYSRMLAETGIIGLAALIILMVTIYRVLSKESLNNNLYKIAIS